MNRYPAGTISKTAKTGTGASALASIVAGVALIIVTGEITQGVELIALGVMAFFGRRSQMPKKRRRREAT